MATTTSTELQRITSPTPLCTFPSPSTMHPLPRSTNGKDKTIPSFFRESVISVYDSGGWVGDLDILGAFNSGSLRQMQPARCSCARSQTRLETSRRWHLSSPGTTYSIHRTRISWSEQTGTGLRGWLLRPCWPGSGHISGARQKCGPTTLAGSATTPGPPRKTRMRTILRCCIPGKFYRSCINRARGNGALK